MVGVGYVCCVGGLVCSGIVGGTGVSVASLTDSEVGEVANGTLSSESVSVSMSSCVPECESVLLVREEE